MRQTKSRSLGVGPGTLIVHPLALGKLGKLFNQSVRIFYFQSVLQGWLDCVMRQCIWSAQHAASAPLLIKCWLFYISRPSSPKPWNASHMCVCSVQLPGVLNMRQILTSLSPSLLNLAYPFILPYGILNMSCIVLSAHCLWSRLQCTFSALLNKLWISKVKDRGLDSDPGTSSPDECLSFN